MNRFPYATGARVLCVAVVLTFSANPSTAEIFRWGDSTTIVQQQRGTHESQSNVTRFEDGHRIITRDGNNTDITIQRQGHSNSPRFGADQRFGEGNHRFDGPDFDRRFSHPDTFDSDGSPGSMPEPSRVQKLFLLRMMERLGSHYMPER